MQKSFVQTEDHYFYIRGRYLYMLLSEPSISGKEICLEILSDIEDAFNSGKAITLEFNDVEKFVLDSGDYVNIFDEEFDEDDCTDGSYEAPYGTCDECGTPLKVRTYTEEVWGFNRPVEEYICPHGCM